jgi:hypothetical protein
MSLLLLPPSSSLASPTASLSDLGRGGCSKSTPRRSPMPASLSLPTPTLASVAFPSPHRLAPRPWAWRLLRNPHLGEARCLFSPPPFSFSSPRLRAPSRPSPRSRTSSVEATPKSAPRRSPMLSLSSPSFPLLPSCLSPPQPRLAPDLGRGGYSEVHTCGEAPCLSLPPPFFPSSLPTCSRPGRGSPMTPPEARAVLSSAFFLPRLPPRSRDLGRGGCSECRHLARSPMPLLSLPLSLSSLPLPFCASPHRLAPDLGRGGPESHTLGEARCLFLSSPFLPLPPLLASSPSPSPRSRTLGVEATPKSTPRRSPMLLSSPFPPSPLFPRLPPAPSPRSPDLGRGGYSEIHT